MIWLLIMALAALSTWFVLRPLMDATTGHDATSSSLEVYRSQLTEIDADLARGLISTAEADAARIEIKRRILNLEASSETGPARQVSRPIAIGGTLACVGLSIFLYAQLGRPSLPGHPYSLREEQAAVSDAATTELEAMVAKLTSHLATTPDDLQGWKALGWAHMRAGRAADGVAAFKRAAELSPKDASVLSMYGEALVEQQAGKVSPEALAVFEQVLSIEPADPRGRYYRGLQLMQAGKLREALDIWIAVIKDSPPDAEWLPSIREQARQLAVQLKLAPEAVP